MAGLAYRTTGINCLRRDKLNNEAYLRILSLVGPASLTSKLFSFLFFLLVWLVIFVMPQGSVVATMRTSSRLVPYLFLHFQSLLAPGNAASVEKRDLVPPNDAELGNGWKSQGCYRWVKP